MHRPNLLFITSDQHRHDYLGAASAGSLRTPNLDALAERGVRFTQCTTNAPVCAPARIALATGMQAARLGCLDNHCYLPPSVPTYYQRLRDSGYRVGCVGKLDLAKPDPYNGLHGDRPRVFCWGFTHPEECEGKMHAGTSPTPIGPYTRYLAERGLLQAFHDDYRKRSAEGWVGSCWDSVLPADAFEDAYIGRRAAEWIEQIPGDLPWHLFVSFVGPHDPFDPPAEYGDRYRDAAVPEPIADDLQGKPAWVQRQRRSLSPDQVRDTRRQYCAAIELIDDQVGRILQALERRGRRDNTWIVYSSDHGEMLGDHGLYTKSLPYEAALRVPLLVAGPGLGSTPDSEAPVELIDVNPTLCELAGLEPQPDLDARSLGPVLRGEAAVHRTETVSGLRGFRCVRTPQHKLIVSSAGELELYDLEADPGELNNVAAAQPERVEHLSRALRRRFDWDPAPRSRRPPAETRS